MILEPKKIKSHTTSTYFPFYLSWSDGTRCHDLSFFEYCFRPAFLLSSFTYIKRLFSSSLLSAIRVVLSAYLRFLIFLLAILIPVCESFSLASWCTPYKLNKQDDSIQPFHIPFPILNRFFAPYPVLTVASWLVYRFLRRQVRWPGIPISLWICQFVVIHTFKGHIANEAKVDAFLEFPCFLYDPMDFGNLISDSSAFFKPSLYIWKFSVQILLMPTLKDF